MAFFQKYYYEFDDIHTVTPSRWRVDILDSVGIVPNVPFKITPGAKPLVTERVDTSDNKFVELIGRQITLSYIYTGHPEEPLPEEFFESDERRWRVEVRKDGVLDGVYFIKPDFSEYPDMYPPFTVQLKAIDGLGYAKGEFFDAYKNDGSLLYEKIPLYEAVVTRSLNRIFDIGTPVKVLQTLTPESAAPGFHLLFDTYVHSDAFIDFVTGPKTVHDVLIELCKIFKARIITDQGAIWFQRVQDLYQESYSIDIYTSPIDVAAGTLDDFVMTAGASTLNDAILINLAGNNVSLPAFKRAEFDFEYKGINQLQNFDWRDYNGSDYADWRRSVGTAPLGRRGDGTSANPYRAEIGFDTDIFHNISQGFNISTHQIRVAPGDIIEVQFPYEFNNTSRGGYLVDLDTLDSDFDGWRMDGSGAWQQDGAGITVSERVLFSRSGRKSNGSVTVKSQPIPAPRRIGGSGAAPVDYRLSILLFPPDMKSYHVPAEPGDIIDSADPDSIRYGAIKLGIIRFSSKGRQIRAENRAKFSRVRETEKVFFIDTGEDGLSNSLFIGPGLEPEDGGWISPKAGVNPRDIEGHMVKGVIEQYQRSVKSWDGQLYSNTLSFCNVIELAHKPGMRYMQCADRYDNRSCTHDVTLLELFQEGTVDVEITETDIENTE